MCGLKGNGAGLVVLFAVVVARVRCRANATVGDGGSLCFLERDGGTEEVRWLVLVVGGSLFLWIFLFFLFHSTSVLFSSSLHFCK